MMRQVISNRFHFGKPLRYPLTLAALFTLLFGSGAYGAVTEFEPNSTVTGAVLAYDKASSSCTKDATGREYCTNQVFRAINEPFPSDPANRDYSPSGGSALDPSLANPLAVTDETRGQLGGTRDFDWFYFDVSASQAQSQPETAISFSCDTQFGFYYEGFVEAPTLGDAVWRVNYYYDPDPNVAGGAVFQGSFLVTKDQCNGLGVVSEGPLRFQANTSRAGRYYVRVWGNYLGDRTEELDGPKITIIKSFDKDGNAVTAEVDTKVTNVYNQIIVNTAIYGLRLNVGRIPGEQEPNDGMTTANPLSPGVVETGQLASRFDEDWFYLDNDPSKNTNGKLSFFFTCRNQTGSAFIVSSYDNLGILQSRFTVQAEQCNTAAGFSYSINTPANPATNPHPNRYYFVVSSVPFNDDAANQFTRNPYTLMVNGNGLPQPVITPTRQPGDLEPSENPVDAVPLAQNVAVTAQLATIIDIDWFSINIPDQSSTGTISVAFECPGLASNSTARWELTAYNPSLNPQNSFQLTAAQCSVAGGFKFNLPVPTAGTYYVQVNAVASSDPASAATNFSQSNYVIRWTTVTSGGGGGGGNGSGNTTIPLPNEVESNDAPVNANPLTNYIPVTGQLSSVADVDFYFYDNNVSQNPTRTVPIYFRCWVASDSSAVYTVAYFDPQGQLQRSYQVTAAQCGVPGGFPFQMSTPETARYYVSVAGPANSNTANFGFTDYTLSTFYNAAAEVPTTVVGTLKQTRIVDRSSANRDYFSVKLGKCSGGKSGGSITLSGSDLNLPPLQANTTIQVRIGSWVCTAESPIWISTSNPNKVVGTYPPPAPPPPKTPTGASGGG